MKSTQTVEITGFSHALNCSNLFKSDSKSVVKVLSKMEVIYNEYLVILKQAAVGFLVVVFHVESRRFVIQCINAFGLPQSICRNRLAFTDLEIKLVVILIPVVRDDHPIAAG